MLTDNGNQFIHTKETLIKKNLESIKNQCKKIDLVEKKDERERQKFGAVFETLARQEYLSNRVETEQQRITRELIEEMYQNAEVILGTSHERPSKPDGISIGFDSNGKLVIEEIIEYKSSENAVNHGFEKGQPAHTYETIGDIVAILNDLTSGKKVSEIPPKDEDCTKDRQMKRFLALQKISKELNESRIISQKLPSTESKITFSPEMVYKIVIPAGENVTPPDTEEFLEKYGYFINFEIVNSSLSKHDIHKIIDTV